MTEPTNETFEVNTFVCCAGCLSDIANYGWALIANRQSDLIKCY